MTMYQNTEPVTIQLTHTVRGVPSVVGKRGSLQLRDKNLYIGDDKMFDIFGKSAQNHSGYIEYNHLDITRKGREYFNVPESWSNHLTKIRIMS